jgi:hypothetical protein
MLLPSKNSFINPSEIQLSQMMGEWKHGDNFFLSLIGIANSAITAVLARCSDLVYSTEICSEGIYSGC